MLAGISPEFYLRLEQRRGQIPFGQVLTALAAAFRLDIDCIAYLETMARPARQLTKEARGKKISPQVQTLIDG